MKDAHGHGSNGKGRGEANGEKHRATIKAAGYTPSRLGSGWLMTHNTSGDSFRANSMAHGAFQVSRTSTGGSDKPFDPSTGFGLKTISNGSAAQSLAAGNASGKSGAIPTHDAMSRLREAFDSTPADDPSRQKTFEQMRGAARK